MQSAGNLADKIMIITGAARGLGESVARGAASRGAKVVLLDVLDTRGQQVADELNEQKIAALYCHCDVTNEADWKTALERTAEAFGLVNVLVNNAAILKFGMLDGFSLDDYRAVIEVNQIGPFLGMKTAAPVMRAAGGGSIINVSSTDGLHGREGVMAYAASKWAIRGMSKVAAQELGAFNIRVNTVMPGGITTEMSAAVTFPGVTLSRDEVRMHWALQRFPEIEEVANVILMLGSDETSYVTGAEIACDGGATIGPKYI
jgi:3alpha(or 20beta)-hydroxysteroid dehydrogenase